MKIIGLTLLTLSMAAQAWAGGFAGSCRYYYLNPVDESTLAATCKKDSGSELFSSLDLNLCLANDAGQLRWGRNGNGLKSCKPCSLDGTNLKCQCEIGNGSKRSTSVNLNDKIGNTDGKLVCVV